MASQKELKALLWRQSLVGLPLKGTSVYSAAEAQHRTLMASINQIQKAEKAEHLARRNDLIDKLTGAWAKRLDEPVDGVEYQKEMRAAWDRNS